MRTFIMAAGVMLVALALAAQESDEKPKPPTYKTPEEVFDAYHAARRKRDYPTMAACLSPPAQKDMAADLALAGIELRANATAAPRDTRDKADKQAASIAEVLHKHGLTVAATKDIKAGTTPQERARAKSAVLEHIKDPAAFIADYLSAADRAPLSGQGKAAVPKLADVKIDGGKAVGKLDLDRADREQTPFVGFVKIGKSWRLAPTLKKLPQKDRER